MQAQVLNFPGSRLLWINAYLPTDPGLMAGWDETNLQECLSEIEKVIRVTEHTDGLLAADLNWDPVRKTQFANIVKDFVVRSGLVSLWSEHPIDYTHISVFKIIVKSHYHGKKRTQRLRCAIL